jgi:DNA-binding transcriptional ArsR family regulator
MPSGFWEDLKRLAGTPFFWPAVADALEHLSVDASYEDLIRYLDRHDAESIQRSILVGTFHCPKTVKGLIDGSLTVAQVVDEAPKPEKQWFGCLGLYPYEDEAPMAHTIKLIVGSPEEYKAMLVRTMSQFWELSFGELWDQVQTQLARSLAEKRRLFESCSLSEFVEQAMLRIEADEEEQALVCCGGQLKIPFDQLTGAYVMPSLFNDKRFWTFYWYGEEYTTFFPYFEPAIALEYGKSPKPAAAEPVELDPAAIFKALGDNTRYTMVTLIAKRPRTAAELARSLQVSKPTVSHHVAQLRQAGLIHEDFSSRSVKLSLKRDVLEGLSDLAVGSLFSRE